MEEAKEGDEEEKMEEGMYEAEEEMDAPAEMDMDADEPEMEMDADMDGDLELTDEEADAIIALGKKLEAAMGEDEPEMDMEDEAPMEMDADEPEMMEDMLEGINYQPSKSELVNEVATRVARRLAEAQKAEKAMNEALGRKK